jgi:ADP-dependent NAD(P)H-hydrate dehydratase / NAD(P)H-hydrate epimerase
MTVTDWLLPLFDAEQMRAIDRWAIAEQRVPSLDLMERAGAGVYRAVAELVPDGPVAVVCGKGNNGGDGLVVARLLREAGRSVTVLCTAPIEELSGDAAANLARLPGAAPLELLEAESGVLGGGEPAGQGELSAGGQPLARILEGVEVIVDALLGTGFEGVPRGAVAEAIEAMGAARAPVVSVDVPSGVDASTGVVSGAAVSAELTVTFHAAKPGLWIHPGKAHAGRILTIDIGIPRGAPTPRRVPTSRRVREHAAAGLLERSVLRELPLRGAASTKFSSGHVVVAGGSRELTGAPRMAALASARTGAGYVTACLPASLQPLLAATLLEVMTRALPEEDGELTARGVPEVLGLLERGGGIAVCIPVSGAARPRLPSLAS